jgi:hypothetical protein
MTHVDVQDFVTPSSPVSSRCRYRRHRTSGACPPVRSAVSLRISGRRSLGPHCCTSGKSVCDRRSQWHALARVPLHCCFSFLARTPAIAKRGTIGRNACHRVPVLIRHRPAGGSPRSARRGRAAGFRRAPAGRPGDSVQTSAPCPATRGRSPRTRSFTLGRRGARPGVRGPRESHRRVCPGTLRGRVGARRSPRRRQRTIGAGVQRRCVDDSRLSGSRSADGDSLMGPPATQLRVARNVTGAIEGVSRDSETVTVLRLEKFQCWETRTLEFLQRQLSKIGCQSFFSRVMRREEGKDRRLRVRPPQGWLQGW